MEGDFGVVSGTGLGATRASRWGPLAVPAATTNRARVAASSSSAAKTRTPGRLSPPPKKAIDPDKGGAFTHRRAAARTRCWRPRRSRRGPAAPGSRRAASRTRGRCLFCFFGFSVSPGGCFGDRGFRSFGEGVGRGGWNRGPAGPRESAFEKETRPMGEVPPAPSGAGKRRAVVLCPPPLVFPPAPLVPLAPPPPPRVLLLLPSPPPFIPSPLAIIVYSCSKPNHGLSALTSSSTSAASGARVLVRCGAPSGL